jgi:transcriptional regulator with XRE-family HTH domain
MNISTILEFSPVNNIRNNKLIRRFGSHLRNLRESHGLTQEELAYEADVPISQVGRIERGEINPTLSTVQALATAMKMSLPEFVKF